MDFRVIKGWGGPKALTNMVGGYFVGFDTGYVCSKHSHSRGISTLLCPIFRFSPTTFLKNMVIIM